MISKEEYDASIKIIESIEKMTPEQIMIGARTCGKHIVHYMHLAMLTKELYEAEQKLEEKNG